MIDGGSNEIGSPQVRKVGFGVRLDMRDEIQRGATADIKIGAGIIYSSQNTETTMCLSMDEWIKKM